MALARAHYAGYAVQRSDGLRIITLNTDMCMLIFFFSRADLNLPISHRVPVRIWEILREYLESHVGFYQCQLLQLHQHDES